MVKKLRTVAAISCAFALTACSVGPDFVRAGPGLAATLVFERRRQPRPENAALSRAAALQPVDPAWWRVFHDATLTSLVRRVADANLDVKTATVRLAESRFQRGAVAAAATAWPEWQRWIPTSKYLAM